ncbi:hypothetical protein DSECCO2_542720 [anaerobic digester metagenome]
MGTASAPCCIVRSPFYFRGHGVSRSAYDNGFNGSFSSIDRHWNRLFYSVPQQDGRGDPGRKNFFSGSCIYGQEHSTCSVDSSCNDSSRFYLSIYFCCPYDPGLWKTPAHRCNHVLHFFTLFRADYPLQF